MDQNTEEVGQRLTLAERSQVRLRDLAPTLAGCTGAALALLNVYPQFFPFLSRADRVLAVAVCLLVVVLGARMLHLAKVDRLDPWLAIAVILLLVVVGVVGVWRGPVAPASTQRDSQLPGIARAPTTEVSLGGSAPAAELVSRSVKP